MEKKNKTKVTILRDTRTSLGIIRKGACLWLPAAEASALISVRVAEATEPAPDSAPAPRQPKKALPEG